jgi:DTW domain-containing protein YfiP
MSREMCYRCNWPARLCWCGSISPLPVRTKFVFLMHPHEQKRVRTNTGRLTHLCLCDSELHVGIRFDEHPAVQALLRDPNNFPVLLYPGQGAHDLSKSETPFPDLAGRRLVVFLLDTTWNLARAMIRDNPGLRSLPHIMFSGAAPSRYVIKKQPEPGCLSTLEATHELLVALERSGLDAYDADASPLLDLFRRMQEFQIRFATEQRNPRHVYKKTPEQRAAAAALQGERRRKIFKPTVPDGADSRNAPAE